MAKLNSQRVETVSIKKEAQTQLSRLIERVIAGEEVVIAKAGKPVARLILAGTSRKPRKPGRMKGKITLDEAFFEPLPKAELRRWEGW